MKKRASIFMTIIMILMMSSMVFAEGVNSMVIDGKSIDTSACTIVNDRTMVPVAVIAHAFGGHASWDSSTKRATITYDQVTIYLTQNSDSATYSKNGIAQTVIMDAKAQIYNSRIVVPINFVAKSLDKSINWDAATRAVTVTSKPDNNSNQPAKTKNEPSQTTDSNDLPSDTPTSIIVPLDPSTSSSAVTVPASPSPSTTPSTVTVPVTDPNAGATQETVYQKIVGMKGEYPEGMSWTNDNFYKWKGGIFSGGYGCAGFAFLLSDVAFDSAPAQKLAPVSMNQLKVGDILRTSNDSHSVVILEIHADHVIVAEGNFNRSIHWGRKIDKATVESSDYYMTRY